jgi:hypothetical protein
MPQDEDAAAARYLDSFRCPDPPLRYSGPFQPYSTRRKARYAEPATPEMKAFLPILVLGLYGCATHPKQYQPPSPERIEASTKRVSIAVDSAHVHARKAQKEVADASSAANDIKVSVATLAEVPKELTQRITDLEQDLTLARQEQVLLESSLAEADKAKAQVEQDKVAYFQEAQKLANAATTERDKRIKDEASLHWYRMHWWGAWIVFGLGILACIILAVLKAAGKLTFL